MSDRKTFEALFNSIPHATEMAARVVNAREERVFKEAVLLLQDFITDMDRNETTYFLKDTTDYQAADIVAKALMGRGWEVTVTQLGKGWSPGRYTVTATPPDIAPAPEAVKP